MKNDPCTRRRALPAALAVSVAALLCGVEAGAAEPPKPAPAPTVADDASVLRLARALRAANDPGAAIPMYRQLADRKGADPEIKVELGECLIDADLVDDALGVLGAIDHRSKAAAHAELAIARAQLKMNQPLVALKHADLALAAAPDDERVLVGRGVALDRVGRHAEAQGSYRKALQAAPRSVAARTDLALSLALSGGFDEALGILSPIARSADATPQDRQNLAFIYGLKGDRSAALALSRADLDEAAAAGNARFFEAVRQAGK